MKTVCAKEYVDNRCNGLDKKCNDVDVRCDGLDSRYNTISESYNILGEALKNAIYTLRKRTYPTVFDDDELTVIMNTSIGSGDITLSQPYTDFDGLLIVCTNDDHYHYIRHYISSTEITYRKEECIKLKRPVFRLFDGDLYWSIKANSKFSSTFFPVDKENCAIECIYGVKFKQIT